MASWHGVGGLFYRVMNWICMDVVMAWTGDVLCCWYDVNRGDKDRDWVGSMMAEIVEFEDVNQLNERIEWWFLVVVFEKIEMGLRVNCSTELGYEFVGDLGNVMVRPFN